MVHEVIYEQLGKFPFCHRIVNTPGHVAEIHLHFVLGDARDSGATNKFRFLDFLAPDVGTHHAFDLA